MLFRVAEGPEGLGAAVDELCRQASQAIKEGYKFLILSDRGVNEEWAPIPSLLGIAAVHHHLVRECTRTEVGLTVETGEPRDVHHFACLIGYGAGTVNPYLVFESLIDMERDGYLPEGFDAQTAEGKFIKAINKGLLKDLFEDGHLDCPVLLRRADLRGDRAQPRRDRPLLYRHAVAGRRDRHPRDRRRNAAAPSPGLRAGADPAARFRRRDSLSHPGRAPQLESGHDLQAAACDEERTIRRRSRSSRSSSTMRASGGRTCAACSTLNSCREPIPLDEVEPAKNIVKRFTTGAMSFGSISKEAHETLAIAMNRLGAKSNTGEGGEDPERFVPLPNGDSKNSYIKQVASARFGVTTPLPGQCQRTADQDGAGREAGRRRTVAGPQGR